MPHSRLLALAALALAAALGAACSSREPAVELPALTGLDRPVSFETDVKPVLDGRCAVCHACYDAPCQLLLTSHAGAARGATKLPVYDNARLGNAEPTRLGVDAHGDGWRERGFFPVLGAANPGDPLLARMLALGAARRFAPGTKLPESVALDIDREAHLRSTRRVRRLRARASRGRHALRHGAPRGRRSCSVLATWLAQGAPGPAPETSAPPADVAVWETFLNGTSLKERIVARYLYEHWFVAHLFFEDRPAGPFYRVVRSRTRPARPIDEIATVRPYDDPGARVLVPAPPARRDDRPQDAHRVPALARAARAPAPALPRRGLDSRRAFRATRPRRPRIPFVALRRDARARAATSSCSTTRSYFVMTFIRGPVCRGQVAVDVIEDQFWIAFADPDRDPSVLDPAFLRENAKLLDLPAEHAENFALGRLWLEYDVKQREYLTAREKFYDKLDPQRLGPTLDWVWDGDGRNKNALLTVFRNFDNAEVLYGFVGATPKTAWVMDYPIFERIYYNLVAGYDVFGKLAHQISTRLYMDHLRMQSENTFLGLLPVDQREPIRASWYVGATREIEYRLADALHSLGHGTQVKFETDDPKRELLAQLIARSPAVAGPPDNLNRCAKPPCDRAGATPDERAAERALQRLAAVKGPWVALLPEVSLLRVRANEPGGRDLVYSLVHNDAHTNVAFMFGEDERRLPADDTRDGRARTLRQLPELLLRGAGRGRRRRSWTSSAAVASEADLERFVERYGVRRTDPRFWETSDLLREDLRRANPIEAGLYDLGRYENL